MFRRLLLLTATTLTGWSKPSGPFSFITWHKDFFYHVSVCPRIQVPVSRMSYCTVTYLPGRAGGAFVPSYSPISSFKHALKSNFSSAFSTRQRPDHILEVTIGSQEHIVSLSWPTWKSVTSMMSSLKGITFVATEPHVFPVGEHILLHKLWTLRRITFAGFNFPSPSSLLQVLRVIRLLRRSFHGESSRSWGSYRVPSYSATFNNLHYIEADARCSESRQLGWVSATTIVRYLPGWRPSPNTAPPIAYLVSRIPDGLPMCPLSRTNIQIGHAWHNNARTMGEEGADYYTPQMGVRQRTA